jgi:uncharacterized protein (TIGR03118 family)
MAFVKRYIKFLTVVTVGVILLAGLAFSSFAFSSRQAARASGGSSSATNSYHQRNLVSNLTTVGAKVQDTNLVNAWGLSHSPTGPWQVSDNGTGVSTQYKSNGRGVPPGVSPVTPSVVVTIPLPGGGPGGAPTGNVFNGTSDFVVTKGSASAPSQFLFATEDGTISGWNPSVDATNALIVVDRSAVSQGGFTGAVYKGLALASNSSGNFLYATNFRFGQVDQFDAHFNFVKHFTDPALASDCPIPGPPAQCFAPFGIQNIGGNLFVTFALQNPVHHDDVGGPGNGFVDEFDTNGNMIRRFASDGMLNSPWGLALAPANFGMFSNDLLVGNFGDGRINAFALGSGTGLGTFIDQLKDPHGNLITINGLWGLAFGNGGLAGDTSTLFFASGLNDEVNGLFGAISAG